MSFIYLNYFSELDVFYHTNGEVSSARSAGIAMFGIEYIKITNKHKPKAVLFLETQEFIYYQGNPVQKFPINTAFCIALQIVLQNCSGIIRRLRMCELVPKEFFDNPDADQTRKTLGEHHVLSDIEYFHMEPHQLESKFDTIIVLQSIIPILKDFKVTDYLTEEGFVLYIGSYADIKPWNLEIIFETTTDTPDNVYLLRPKYEFPNNYAAIQVRNDQFDWVEELKQQLDTKAHKSVVMYSQKEEHSGIVGLLNCVLKEAPQTRAILIEDDTESNKITFDINNNFIREQLNKNLALNIVRNGRWGTLVYYPFVHEDKKEVADAGFKIKTTGDLTTLSWEELPPKQP